MNKYNPYNPSLESSLLNDFSKLINEVEEPGDVLEFGTGSGSLSVAIAYHLNPNRKIYTFDGFVGLPETKKGVPLNSNWVVGAFCWNVDEVKKELSQYNNIIVEQTMSWDLKLPSEYGIKKIIAANMDFDLYEGTLDGLRFIEKCEWERIILRFDDWGAYNFEVRPDVDVHEKAAFFDWINETKYNYMIREDLVKKSTGAQSIIIVSRLNKE